MPHHMIVVEIQSTEEHGRRRQQSEKRNSSAFTNVHEDAADRNPCAEANQHDSDDADAARRLPL